MAGPYLKDVQPLPQVLTERQKALEEERVSQRDREWKQQDVFGALAKQLSEQALKDFYERRVKEDEQAHELQKMDISEQYKIDLDERKETNTVRKETRAGRKVQLEKAASSLAAIRALESVKATKLMDILTKHPVTQSYASGPDSAAYKELRESLKDRDAAFIKFGAEIRQMPGGTKSEQYQNFLSYAQDRLSGDEKLEYILNDPDMKRARKLWRTEGSYRGLSPRALKRIEGPGGLLDQWKAAELQRLRANYRIAKIMHSVYQGGGDTWTFPEDLENEYNATVGLEENAGSRQNTHTPNSNLNRGGTRGGSNNSRGNAGNVNSNRTPVALVDPNTANSDAEAIQQNRIVGADMQRALRTLPEGMRPQLESVFSTDGTDDTPAVVLSRGVYRVTKTGDNNEIDVREWDNPNLAGDALYRSLINSPEGGAQRLTQNQHETVRGNFNIPTVPGLSPTVIKATDNRNLRLQKIIDKRIERLRQQHGDQNKMVTLIYNMHEQEISRKLVTQMFGNNAVIRKQIELGGTPQQPAAAAWMAKVTRERLQGHSHEAMIFKPDGKTYRPGGREYSDILEKLRRSADTALFGKADKKNVDDARRSREYNIEVTLEVDGEPTQWRVTRKVEVADVLAQKYTELLFDTTLLEELSAAGEERVVPARLVKDTATSDELKIDLFGDATTIVNPSDPRFIRSHAQKVALEALYSIPDGQKILSIVALGVTNRVNPSGPYGRLQGIRSQFGAMLASAMQSDVVESAHEELLRTAKPGGYIRTSDWNKYVSTIKRGFMRRLQATRQWRTFLDLAEGQGWDDLREHDNTKYVFE